MACDRKLVVVVVLLAAASGHADVHTTAVYSVPVPDHDPDIVVGDWVLPDTPAPGFARVKMLRSEICNTDRRVLAGTKTAEVAKEKLVLGHEGIGVVDRSSSTSNAFAVGDLVVLEPHYVQPDDQMLKKGLPNLSPYMKHLGIHINGVFADLMDFSDYQIHKILAKDAFEKLKDRSAFLDQLVMIEPLACVTRGYKLIQQQDFFNKANLTTALILGSGPMGMIHALHLQNKFPNVRVDMFDVDPTRRKLARNTPYLKAKVLDALPANVHYDLVVTATSSREASTDAAIHAVKNNGIILVFSGIDMKDGDPRPMVDSVDIESVHRREGVVRLVNHDVDGEIKAIYFVGTSGYVHGDFDSSIAELTEDFARGKTSLFHGVSTTVINGLKSPKAVDVSGRFHDVTFRGPALASLLRLYSPEQRGDENVHNYLKISVRHDQP